MEPQEAGGASSDGEEAPETLEAKVRSRALRVLARREKSRRGLELLLRRAGFPRQAVDPALDRLAAEGILDDRRFCRLYLGEQSRLRPRSPDLLRRDLRREGIDPAVIEEACREMAADLDEERLALEAARRKLRLTHGDRGRLVRLLRARGFGRRSIEAALNELGVAEERDEERS